MGRVLLEASGRGLQCGCVGAGRALGKGQCWHGHRAPGPTSALGPCHLKMLRSFQALMGGSSSSEAPIGLWREAWPRPPVWWGWGANTAQPPQAQRAGLYPGSPTLGAGEALPLL